MVCPVLLIGAGTSGGDPSQSAGSSSRLSTGS